MEYLFSIIAGFGVILFLIGYLGFVVAGFKHHFVTGIISALPVLNVVTIPALWRATSKKLTISTIGLIIIIASWFLGANTGVQKIISMLGGGSTISETISTSPITTNTNVEGKISSKTSEASTVNPLSNKSDKPYANQQHIVDESRMQLLPKKALYRMSFEIIPVNKIQTLQDRVVKIITNNNEQLEGRIIKITPSSIFINTNELPIANIKQISLMVKKAN